MIVVVEQHNVREYASIVDEMFRLRARIFRGRLGWDVRVVDEKERDRYDDEGPVYVIDVDDTSQRVRGSLRLLPTTGPTLLADFFSDTLPDAAYLTDPTIWECTRFCLDDKILDRGHREELHLASANLIVALGEVAIQAGIESIVGNFDPAMIRVYRRIGCEVEILGSTMRYGRPVYLGLFPVSEDILQTIKHKLRVADDQARDKRLVATRPRLATA